MISMFLALALLFLLGEVWRQREKRREGRWQVLLGGCLLLLVFFLWALPRGVILAKVVGKLAMPPGLLWLAVLAGLFLAFQKRHWRSFFGFLALWLFVSLAGNTYLGGRGAALLEKKYLSLRPLQMGPFEAVLVLGGGTNRTDLGDAFLNASGDRVMLAARLYHQRRTSWLVTSGSTLPGARHKHNLAQETQQIWTSLGIPAKKIVMIPGPYNTRTEVRAYARLVRQRRWQRVGLVTSAWHLRRALRLCRKHKLKVQPLPADIVSAQPYKGLRSLIPDGFGFYLNYRVAWELLGAFLGK